MPVLRYKLVLTAKGPVHIGNGNKYGKKDYFLQGDKITILDAARFTAALNPEQLKSYCEFLQESSQSGLQDFLEEHRLAGIAAQAAAYQLDLKLARARRGTYQYLDASEFVKDVYGCPYVPGSAVKGMLRTAILTSFILDEQDSYRQLYDSDAARAVKDANGRKKAGKPLEKRGFWVERPSKEDPDIVNDIMRYVSVSDSSPLSTSDLVFVKKYDKFARADDGSHKRQMGRLSDDSYYEGNELNIYRECLKPGTRIELSLSIDERIGCYIPLDSEAIRSVLTRFCGLYDESFSEHFDFTEDSGGATGASGAADGRCRYIAQTGPFPGTRCRNNAVGDTGYCNSHKDKASAAGNDGGVGSGGGEVLCYLGGGVDFDSKTVLNALFKDDPKRLDVISRILYSQFPSRVDKSIYGGLVKRIGESGFEPKHMSADYKNGRLKKAKDDHRHWRDSELGVSPHTLKLGKIGDRLYRMGLCSLSLEEAP
jgi:CRISPR/Cas system CSM-associated protein Csm5 (group 7 of RAMP superfamily)